MGVVAAAVGPASGAGCGPAAAPADAGLPAVDIFLLAASDVPGGALMGAWVPPQGAAYRHAAYLVGGYAGVDPGTVPAGARPGRLLGFDGAQTFTTLCGSDHALLAVAGVGGVVYAAGEGGAFLQYRADTGACTPIAVPASGAAPPTFAGLVGTDPASGALDLVGYDAAGGVIYHDDGAAVTRVALPGAPLAHLRGIAFDPVVGAWAVGEQGLVLYRAAGSTATAWAADATLPAGYARPLAAVSTEVSNTPSARRWTMVVGGDGGAAVLARKVTDAAWEVRADVPAAPGAALRSVVTVSECEVYMVGTQGATAVFTGATYYQPPTRWTSADLQAVAGNVGLVVAVGGNAGAAAADQRGVILVRGGLATNYVVDGVSYAALGSVKQDVCVAPGGQ